MKKKFKKITPEEREQLNKAVTKKLRKIGKLKVLDDAFRQLPKLNNE